MSNDLRNPNGTSDGDTPEKRSNVPEHPEYVDIDAAIHKALESQRGVTAGNIYTTANSDKKSDQDSSDILHSTVEGGKEGAGEQNDNNQGEVYEDDEPFHNPDYSTLKFLDKDADLLLEFTDGDRALKDLPGWKTGAINIFEIWDTGNITVNDTYVPGCLSKSEIQQYFHLAQKNGTANLSKLQAITRKLSNVSGSMISGAGVLFIKAFKATGKGLKKYRRGREHPFALPVDTVVRGGGLGWGAYVASNWALSSSYMVNAVARGDLLARFGLVPGAGLLTAGAVLGVRRGADELRYWTGVKNKFKECVDDIYTGSEGAVAEIREFIQDKIGKKSEEILNTNEEQELIQALHAMGVVRPSEAPFLATPSRYAEYCFTKLTELCEEASERELNKLPPKHGLTAPQQKTLADFDLQNPDDGKKLEHRNSLLEISIVYGRLIANYHRDKREAQLTGAIAGASISTAGLTAGISLGIGGLAYLARKKWRQSQKELSHIEITPNGKLEGKYYPGTKIRQPIVQLDVTKQSGGFFDAGMFHECSEMKFEDLSPNAKLWWTHIKIPEHLKAPSAELLAHAAMSSVLDILSTSKGIKEKGKDEDIEKNKAELDEATVVLREMRERKKQLPKEVDQAKEYLASMIVRASERDVERVAKSSYVASVTKYEREIAPLERELMHYRGDPSDPKSGLITKQKNYIDVLKSGAGDQEQIDEASGKLTALSNQAIQIEKQILDLRDRLEPLQARLQLDERRENMLEEQRGAEKKIAENKLSRLNAELNRLDGVDTANKEGSIEKQIQAVDTMRADLHKLKNGKESTEALGLEQVLHNEDIRRAFYVKVHQAFKIKHDKEDEGKGMVTVYGNKLKRWLAGKAMGLADAAGTSVVNGVVTGVVAGSTVGYLFALDPLKWGAVAAAVTAALSFINRMTGKTGSGGGGHAAPKTDEKPSEKH